MRATCTAVLVFLLGACSSTPPVEYDSNELVLKLYDVSDSVGTIYDMPARGVIMLPNALPGDAITPKEYSRRTQEALYPGQWKDKAKLGWGLDFQNGLWIVRGPEEFHRKVEQFTGRVGE